MTNPSQPHLPTPSESDNPQSHETPQKPEVLLHPQLASRRRAIMTALHQGSLVFFSIFAAFFLSIYLGLWVAMGVSLLIESAPIWFLKFVAVPLVLEAGIGLGGIAVLYLLGRFVELPFVATQIGFWAGLHGLNLLMKWVLGQFTTAYGDTRIWMLRLPAMALFIMLGHFSFRAALRRRQA